MNGKKFWLDEPSVLLQNIQMVPLSSLSLNDQLNALTRLILGSAIVMWLFDFKYTLHFLVFSLAFIISIYYIQKRTMKRCQENYTPPTMVQHRLDKQFIPVQPYDMGNLVKEKRTIKNGQVVSESIIQTSEALPFCNDSVTIDPPNPFAVSLNQQLVGDTANPTTKIKPVIVPPSHALDYWKDNNLIQFSQINTAGPQEDMYLSGYAESNCCDYIGCGSELVPNPKETRPVYLGGGIRENYTLNKGCGPQQLMLPLKNTNRPCSKAGGQIVSPMLVEDRPYVPVLPVMNPSVNAPRYNMPIEERYAPQNACNRPSPARDGRKCSNSVGNIKSPYPSEDRPFIPRIPVNSKPTMPVVGTPFVENFSYDRYTTIDNPENVYVQPNQSGWVNTACGYNADQVFESGLPSNLPAGNCEQDPQMKRYNENLFTSIVTPGVYTRNQVNEPINSNIGISFQQQFEPTTCLRDDNRGLIYTQHDPRIIEPVLEDIPQDVVEDKANYDNVYDPRFYGYGTSYRSYNEPMVNQTRFFYDDVNAIRMPSYITRSKIDHLPFADTYESPPQGSEFGNVHNPHIRALAQDAWLRDSLEFRNDLTERRMRKINSEAWQKRQFPNSARPVGTCKR